MLRLQERQKVYQPIRNNTKAWFHVHLKRRTGKLMDSIWDSWYRYMIQIITDFVWCSLQVIEMTTYLIRILPHVITHVTFRPRGLCVKQTKLHVLNLRISAWLWRSKHFTKKITQNGYLEVPFPYSNTK